MAGMTTILDTESTKSESDCESVPSKGSGLDDNWNTPKEVRKSKAIKDSLKKKVTFKVKAKWSAKKPQAKKAKESKTETVGVVVDGTFSDEEVAVITNQIQQNGWTVFKRLSINVSEYSAPIA